MKRRAINRVLDSDALESVTGILAKTELQVVEAAQGLDQSLPGDDVIESTPSVETRSDAFAGLIRALATGEFKEFWCSEILDVSENNIDELVDLLGMSESEWDDMRRRQAQALNSAGAEGGPREIVDDHLRDQWGIGIDQFEREIVEWERGPAAERLYAGNLVLCREVIDKAQRVVEEPESALTEQSHD